MISPDIPNVFLRSHFQNEDLCAETQCNLSVCVTAFVFDIRPQTKTTKKTLQPQEVNKSVVTLAFAPLFFSFNCHPGVS